MTKTIPRSAALSRKRPCNKRVTLPPPLRREIGNCETLNICPEKEKKRLACEQGSKLLLGGAEGRELATTSEEF